MRDSVIQVCVLCQGEQFYTCKDRLDIGGSVGRRYRRNDGFPTDDGQETRNSCRRPHSGYGVDGDHLTTEQGAKISELRIHHQEDTIDLRADVKKQLGLHMLMTAAEPDQKNVLVGARGMARTGVWASVGNESMRSGVAQLIPLFVCRGGGKPCTRHE